jgi:hypothetical protein
VQTTSHSSRGRALGGVKPPRWVLGLFLGITLATVAITLLLVLVPPASVPAGKLTHSGEVRLTTESNVRATILQFAAGIVLIVGLCLTARTVYVSRETHLTDRFTKAVDQLGHDRLEVRVGGIHALDRLARNSPSDRRLVIEVLSAYLHINASLDHTSTSPSRGRSSPRRGRISPDVQTALSILTSL